MTAIHNRQTYLFLASAGLLQPDVKVLHKFGANRDVDSVSVPEDINTLGGDVLFPDAASTISIVSASVNDTDGGTGINKVVISGLDSDFNEISEEVTLQGQTPVVTDAEFLRVNRMAGILAGSGKSAAGSIVGTHDEGDIIQILAGEGQSFMAAWTVPAGFRFLISSVFVSVERKGDAVVDIHLERKIMGQNVWRALGSYSVSSNGTSSLLREYDIPLYVGEKTDLRLRVVALNANDVTVTGQFDGIYYQNGGITA